MTDGARVELLGDHQAALMIPGIDFHSYPPCYRSCYSGTDINVIAFQATMKGEPLLLKEPLSTSTLTDFAVDIDERLWPKFLNHFFQSGVPLQSQRSQRRGGRGRLRNCLPYQFRIPPEQAQTGSFGEAVI